jgi:hypothetical protein
MNSSPASSGAKRLIQRCGINPTTPLPESLIQLEDYAQLVNESAF